MNRLVILACKLAIIGFVADLARRGWQSLDLKPWQVADMGWLTLFFTLALLLAVGYTLVLLGRARAAIARRQAHAEEEQV